MVGKKRNARNEPVRTSATPTPPRLAAFWLGYHPLSLRVLEVEGLAALEYEGFDGSAFLGALAQFETSVKRLADELPDGDYDELMELSMRMNIYWNRRLREGTAGDNAAPEILGDGLPEGQANDSNVDEALQSYLNPPFQSPSDNAERLIELTEQAIGAHPRLGLWYRAGIAFGRLHAALVDDNGALQCYRQVLDAIEKLPQDEQELVPTVKHLLETSAQSLPDMAIAIRNAAVKVGPLPGCGLPARDCPGPVALQALPYVVSGISSNLMAAAPKLAHRCPYWDRSTLTLRFGEHKIYTFLSRAEAMIKVLDAFQDAGWPERVKNPFPEESSVEGVNGADTLRQTVKDLNKRVRSSIKFHILRAGAFVSWECLI